MKTFHLSVAEGIRQNAQNKKYSTHAEISSLDDIKRAVLFDHVAGYFKNDERSVPNFIEADCIIMDCDNDHSDNPAEWLTPERLSERLHNVPCVIVGSRNNNKVKGDKSARPRYHVYFPLSETITQASNIRDMKERLLKIVPEFDGGAKDAARFIYGVDNPQAEIIEGSMFVDEFLTINAPDDFMTFNAPDEGAYTPPEQTQQTPAPSEPQQATDDSHVIHEGQRNNTLFTIGLNAQGQYGDTKKAREVFDKAVASCQPPLPAGEAIKIWEQAQKYAKAIRDRVIDGKMKVLTLRVIEQALRDMNISLRFNVITRDIDVSELPPDNEHAPASYYALDEARRKKAAADMLPAFLTSYFKSKNYGVSDKFLMDALAVLAQANPLNPVIELLKATTWDSNDRIAELYRVLGITNDMQKRLVQKWLHQAVALADNDKGDLNADFVLVLQGRQGIGKTNFFRALAMRPEWFNGGAVIDMQNKDTIMQATNTWITEIGEFDETLKKKQAALKALITANFDIYRIPYARKAVNVERRTVFAATVNPAETIRDSTGSRRYVVIHVDDIDKAFLYGNMTPEWVALLWRQVYETLYLPNRKGYFLTDEERAYIEQENEAYTVMLDGESELRDCLQWETDTGAWQWTTLAQLERRSPYLRDKRFPAYKLGRALTKILQWVADKEEGSISDFKKVIHGRAVYRIPQNNPLFTGQ